MENYSYFMNKALLQAKKALKKDEVPVGAIIVKDNKIIASAYNQKESKRLATSHAEINVINKACKKLNDWYLKGCTMYVTLEPCLMCAGAINQARIEKVVYGAINNQDGAYHIHKILEMKGLNHYPEVEYFDSLEQCSKIISLYFQSKR